MSSPYDFATSHNETLPNPYTPLAFLTPALASQIEVARYLMVATCGMFAWDILTNIRNDYRMLTEFKMTWPVVTYFVSRLMSYVYIITATTFDIGTADNCQALQVALGVCFSFAVPSTSLLFYYRICAVFNQSLFIRAFFGIIWVATLAGCLTVPFSITGGHIGTTKHCFNHIVKPQSSMGIVVSTINDTLVCLFISWRLTQSPVINRSFRERLGTFFNGKGLPRFTKSLLKNGQEYYLITVGGNILTMSLILAPSSLPAVYRAMTTVPNMAVTNAMACRVFRDIKFGKINVDGTNPLLTGLLPTFVKAQDPEVSEAVATGGEAHCISLGIASIETTPPT